MIHKLFLVELRQLLKNIVTYIAFGLVIAMFLTQCLPKHWYWYAAPMDEKHFMYTVLLDDYSSGHTEEIKANGMVVCTERPLDKADKELIMQAIRQMNPDYEKGELVSGIDFTIPQEEYETLMKNLDQAFGGDSYYIDPFRTKYYNMYVSNAFHIDSSLSNSEKIAGMDDYLDYIINVKKFSQYSELFITKTIKLTDEELLNLSKEDHLLQNAKINETSVDELYRLYDEHFLAIDSMLGGNTQFGSRYREYCYNRNNNLEDENRCFGTIQSEKITNAYARYYSDYLGVLAGILPAVFGAFILIDIRRHRMQEMIYAKPVGSFAYVISKFLAITAVFGILFYLLAIVSTVLFYRFGQTFRLELDYLAFFKYTTFWIMPTVLITTALSMLLSLVLNSGVLVIAVQILIFFKSAMPLIGNYVLYRPILRYNTIGEIDYYKDHLPVIVANRVFITVISFVMLYVTVKVFDVIRKRGNYKDSIWNRIILLQKRSI